MDISKDYLKKKGITPKISFKDGKPHTVVLVKDKVETIKNQTGEDIEGIKYLVTEGGEPKFFFTSSIGLIQKLADIKEDEEVTIVMKSRKGETGYVSYYEVTKKGDVGNEYPSGEPEIDIDETPIPVIED